MRIVQTLNYLHGDVTSATVQHGLRHLIRFFFFLKLAGFKFKQDSLKSFFLIPICSRHGVRDAKAESLQRGETFFVFYF
jgi:hypothetical protein